MKHALGTPARLAWLKAQPREPGEAGFFWHEAQFGREAVKVLPGEYFVASDDILVMTTLGSCIAACLWDRRAGIGGLNHFMLPESSGSPDDTAGGRGGRYGAFAMELLINQMMKHGAARSQLEAKVFGGGQVVAGMDTLNVGERNTRFVLDYLKTERIPVVSKDVLDIHPRKVCFLPASGKAMVKRLAATGVSVFLAQERAAAAQPTPEHSGAGSIDLF